MSAVAIALATQDFDPTEVAVPWRALTAAGHEVVFATADGAPGACDPEMLAGVFFRQIRALPEHAALYEEMATTEAFQAPVSYADLDPERFALLVLPGGHAPGMRQYLENAALQEAAARFLATDRLVGAICHGTVVLARSIDPETGRSVLAGRRLTTLPKRFEVGAWALTKPYKGDYFRTYPTWVEDEVRAAVADGQVETGPFLPVHGQGFVVRDGPLITARWPGDAERFGEALVEALA